MGLISRVSSRTYSFSEFKKIMSDHEKVSDVESEPEKEEQVEEENETEEFNWDLAIPNRSEMTWVDIQKKRLREIPENALKGLDKCEEVCLRYNLIKDMSPVRHLKPETLVELDLYDNHLK